MSLMDRTSRWLPACNSKISRSSTLEFRWPDAQSGTRISRNSSMHSKESWVAGRTRVFRTPVAFSCFSGCLPKRTINKIRSLSYQSLWGTQKEVRWKDITFPRAEGGLAIRDNKQLHQAAMVDRARRLWSQPGIWASWTERRYVKQRSLDSITKRAGDSALWRHTIKNKTSIAKCMVCDSNGILMWIGGSTKAFGRQQGNEDPRKDGWTESGPHGSPECPPCCGGSVGGSYQRPTDCWILQQVLELAGFDLQNPQFDHRNWT